MNIAQNFVSKSCMPFGDSEIMQVFDELHTLTFIQRHLCKMSTFCWVDPALVLVTSRIYFANVELTILLHKEILQFVLF